jgi:HD-GYP domain-containing protein (c-di-GMP phosphodiesterase class II)
MSPTKKKEPEGENIDGYLREFKKIKKKDRSPEKQWLAGGDSDQDLASIFQEFQQRTSVKGGFVQDSKAGSLLGEVTEGKLNQMEPHDPLQSDGEEPEEESDQPEGQLYDRAEAYVVESIQRAGSNQSPQLDEGADLVGRMIDSLKKESALILRATQKNQEFSLGSHCVNVCILSLRITQTLQYRRARCVQVGLIALLHEIGIARVAHQIESGVGDLNLELRQRPIYSSEILGRLGPEYDWLILAVGQVGEREDGSGFPLGLMGSTIHEEAKIVGISDLLESCIHDRPYRKALTGYQLLTEMVQSGKKSFSSRLIKALIGSFSVYIYNEYVLLSTGEVGRVTEVNTQNLLRPQIEILYDSEGQALEEPRHTDLTEHTSRFITRAIHPDDLSGLW